MEQCVQIQKRYCGSPPLAPDRGPENMRRMRKSCATLTTVKKVIRIITRCLHQTYIQASPLAKAHRPAPASACSPPLWVQLVETRQRNRHQRTSAVSRLAVFEKVLGRDHFLQGPVELLHRCPQSLEVLVRRLVMVHGMADRQLPVHLPAEIHQPRRVRHTTGAVCSARHQMRGEDMTYR